MKFGNEEMVIKDCEVMDSYISSGFFCKWFEKELVKEFSIYWYFLYYLIIFFMKFGKVCIVFVVVVEYEGILFNKNLLSGLDMINSLFGVFLCFC